MKEERRKKGQEIIKEIIARYLVEELAEEMSEYGIVTVTEVKMSADLSYTDVYVSAFKNSENLVKELALSAKELERRICKSTALIKIPRIRFKYDVSGEENSSMYEQIKNLHS